MSMSSFLAYSEVKRILLNINNQEHQAFLCLTYGCLGRVGEVVRHHKDIRSKPPKKWDNPPITTKNITLKRTKKGVKKLEINVLTEKVHQNRKVIILGNKEEWLISIILKWRLKIDKGFTWNIMTKKWIPPEENYRINEETGEHEPFFVNKDKAIFLFNKSTRWGEKVFEKYFGTQEIHSLRHWRITHLLSGKATGKPVMSNVVARMSGHKYLATQSTYDHSIVEDYEDEIY